LRSRREGFARSISASPKRRCRRPKTAKGFHRRQEASANLAAWVAAGKLKIEDDVIDGLENTPAALMGLLAGENRGKRMIKV